MIETEHTPNPDTLKFLPGKKVSEVGPVEFLKNNKNITVPLASTILSLEFLCVCFIENGKLAKVVSSENDPAIIYDSEGGVYPADIMALAVLLNSD